jgi:hypothetical protein
MKTYGTLIQLAHAIRMMNSGFFREHRLPLPFPKKNTQYSAHCKNTAECESSDH